MKYQVRSNSDVVPGNIHTSPYYIVFLNQCSIKPETSCNSFKFLFSYFLSNLLNILSFDECEICSHIQSINYIKESEMPSNKTNPTLEKINLLTTECVTKLKLFQSEPWRNLTADDDNRAKVDRMVKGAAVQYGPRINQPVGSDFKFDLARLMYTERADFSESLDLDDFLSEGEQYMGETHLCILVSWESFLTVVKRTLQGRVGPNRTATPAERLKLCYDMTRILRHVETFSCWREQGTNEFTGDTFLFNWPKEQATFPNNFYKLAVQERAYATDDLNSFGLKWRARPVLEEDEANDFDDSTHPADVKRATARKRNKDAKELGSLIGE